MNFTTIYEKIDETPLSTWLDDLPKQVDRRLNGSRWGDLPRWKEVLENLPELKASAVDLNSERIIVGSDQDCDAVLRDRLKDQLHQFDPWRKGPYEIFGIHIDSEWRSDLKWDRLKNHIEPLRDRLVLDVGCGNGYHCWRMAGEHAKLVVGIDPTMFYVMQFQAIQKYIDHSSVSVLPIGIDDVQQDLNHFDTAFSMGLLYHRRSPLDHLLQMRSFLRDDGQLILETLIIDGPLGKVLTPKDRYAKMKNVWFIPSPATLELWLKRTGFKNIQMIDITKTNSEEQRVTQWIGAESLSDFLDPDDSRRTVEGYPAPKRAIFLAKK